MKRIISSVFVLFVFLTQVDSQVTQWRGPDRDGIFYETGLLKVWPEEGPERLFKVEGVGRGYSSPIVNDDRIFITGMIDSADYLSSLNLEGKLLWQVPYGKSWERSYPDTRSSPTIDDDRVYVLSGNGILSCFDANTGESNWTINVDKDFESERHVWGVAETPLIVDGMVLCTPGGQKTSVVAFDKITGKLIWQSKSLGSQRSYVSPIIYENEGTRLILAVTARHLIALEPGTGEIVWTFNYYNVQEWSHQPGLIWANSPIYKGNDIFITKGYDHPSVMLEINEDGKGVSEKFRSDVLDNHHHGVVLVDGYIYGSNWRNNSKGFWICMDWETGEIKYEHDWVSKGSIIYADGLLYSYVEKNGAVGLIKPNSEKFDLISTFRVKDGTGPHWAHPFIKNAVLYLRHGDVLMAYDIKER